MSKQAAWKVLLIKKAEKEFSKLNASIQKDIYKAVKEKLIKSPDKYLTPLVGNYTGFYKFRVGHHRIICKKENQRLIILIIKIAHRKKVYKQ